MRTVYLIWVMSLLTFGTAAQNFRPFTTGRTYHYRDGATQAGRPEVFYSLEVDSIYQRGTDSVFCFNPINVPDSSNFFGVPVAVRANIFGGRLYWNAVTGEAVFQTQYRPASVRLLTRGAVGQTWAFTPNVQARLVARQAQTTFGQPDTVLIIALSSGPSIRISRLFGLLESPNFSAYLGTTFAHGVPPVRQLALVAIPEENIGALDMRWMRIFQFQAGDTLNYRARWEGLGSLPQRTLEQRHRIIVASALLPNRRIVTRYTETIRAEYWTPNRSQPDSVLYTSNQVGVDTISFWNNAFLSGGSFEPMCYASLLEQTQDSLGGAPKGVLHCSVMDIDNIHAFAQGLGIVYQRFAGMNRRNGVERLIGFGSSRQHWGNTQLPSPLGTLREVTALKAVIMPNLSQAEINSVLSFSTEKPQTATLALYDGLGREIWRQEKMLATGEQHLPINMSHQAPGLYRLRLTLADGRQRVLPLVRE